MFSKKEMSEIIANLEDLLVNALQENHDLEAKIKQLEEEKAQLLDLLEDYNI